MPEAGTLRHRVTFQRNQGARDVVGEVVPDWQAVYEDVPAAVEPLAGREFYAARQFNAEVTHKVTLRQEGRTIRAADRVLFGTRLFDINVIRSLHERGAWLELLCTEKA